MVLDCQATGNHPPTAHLFEIGWSAACAGGPAGAVACDSVSFLLQLTDGVSISRAVERLTGIDSSDLSVGARTPDVYRQLEAAAHRLPPVGRNGLCPTVIHFARYEKAFLRHLHRTHSLNRVFPFDIICTHDITRRLIPGLRRKGLRAVAGFLGHSVPALKRCAAHTVATAFIWQNLVRLLAQDAGIHTWDELRDWLRTCPVPSTKRSFPMPREARAAVPDRPGIYRMLRSNGDILDIGKAASLKQRVNSYFQTSRRHAEHTLEMLSQAVGLEVTPTASALEAALLESGEIKRVCPPYNKALQEGRRQLVFGAKDFRYFHPSLTERITSDRFPAARPLPQCTLSAACCNRVSRRLTDCRKPRRRICWTWDHHTPATLNVLSRGCGCFDTSTPVCRRQRRSGRR